MSRTALRPWAFWSQWMLASAAGMGLGWALGWAADSAAAEPITATVGYLVHGFAAQHLVQRLLNGAVIGAGIGLAQGSAQWLVLRRYLRRAGWWLPASVVGWALGWALAQATGRGIAGALQQVAGWPGSSSEIAALVGVVAGGLVGLAQWPALQGKVRRAGCWVLASAAGGALLWPVAAATIALGRPEIWLAAAGWGVGGGAAGALSGACAVWLLRSSSRSAI